MSTVGSPSLKSQNSFIILCSPSRWSNISHVITKVVPRGKLPASAHDRREKKLKMAVQWLRLCTPLQEAWIPSLVRELRSHKLCGVARKNELLKSTNKYLCQIGIMQYIKLYYFFHRLQIFLLIKSSLAQFLMTTKYSKDLP